MVFGRTFYAEVFLNPVSCKLNPCLANKAQGDFHFLLVVDPGNDPFAFLRIIILVGDLALANHGIGGGEFSIFQFAVNFFVVLKCCLLLAGNFLDHQIEQLGLSCFSLMQLECQIPDLNSLSVVVGV